jgi:hypothetical protein
MTVRRKNPAQEEREKANIGLGPTLGISGYVVWEPGSVCTTVAARSPLFQPNGGTK